MKESNLGIYLLIAAAVVIVAGIAMTVQSLLLGGINKQSPNGQKEMR